jgi:hypothetical protein
MKNIGPKSSSWLKAVGITSREELISRGVAEVYVELKLEGFTVSKNMLWALWGAAEGEHWNNIPDSEKQRLLKQIDELSG